MKTESDIKESLLAALATVGRGGRLMVEATTQGGRSWPVFPSGRLKTLGKVPDGFERILCICPMGGIEYRATGAPAGRWRLRAADGREVFLAPRTPPPSKSRSRSRGSQLFVHEHELIGIETEEDVAILLETEWQILPYDTSNRPEPKLRRGRALIEVKDGPVSEQSQHAAETLVQR